MQPTSNIRAMQIAAEHYGRSITSDRDFLQTKVNDLRRAMWKDKAARETLFKGEACECARCYTDACVTNCRGKYTGITLPVNVVGLERLEVNGEHIDIIQQRLPNRGCCGPSCAPCREGEVLPMKVILSHDIPSSYNNRLIFRAKSPADKGKKVGVEYVTRTGAIIREDVVLRTSGNATSHSPVAILKLTLPVRCQFVTVEMVGGFVLDSFHPSVISPKRLRVRLNGVKAGAIVKWTGLVEPMPVVFDTDMVEWDNSLDWRNGFMALDLHFQTGKSPSETFAYKAALEMQRSSAASELEASQSVPVRNIRPRGIARLIRRMAPFTTRAQ